MPISLRKKIMREEHSTHPAYNINKKRIMVKATILAVKIVAVTLSVIYLFIRHC